MAKSAIFARYAPSQRPSLARNALSNSPVEQGDLMKMIGFLLFMALVMISPGLTAQDAEQAEAGSEAAQPDERGSRSVRRLGDMVGRGDDEWSMDIPDIAAPATAINPQPEVSLPDAEQDARLQNLLARRAFSPNDPQIDSEMNALMTEVGANADAALNAGDLALAQRLINVIVEFSPEQPVITRVQAELARQANLAAILANAEQALVAGNLTSPQGESASDLYAQALAIDAGNEVAEAGLEAVFAALLARALEQAQDFDFEAAEATLTDASGIWENPDAIAETRASIVDFRERYVAQLDESVLANIDSGNLDQAEAEITRLIALDHDRSRIAALQASLSDTRMYGRFEPGQVFSDSLDALNRVGPELVVIPVGSFMMGSPDNEVDRFANEGPRHRVTFNRGFALARTEVTVAQFADFINSTGYRTDAERAGQSRVYDARTGRMDSEAGITWRNNYVGEEADPELPVIHVSWNDAQAYASWLAQQTGRQYRLPSEAEFEYALRAGSQTLYWWGEGSPDNNTENLTGDGDSSPTNARWNVAFRRYTDGFWGPAPVASLRANPFGLYDMGGNVMEWVEDCWHDSFVRAPDDGSAWVNPGCERRVIKGGAWSSTPPMARSAFRLSSTAQSTDMRVGFRVARDL